MAKNANLKAANKNKNDEFYTGYEDIKNELIHYAKYFKGKTIYCNCDDHNGIGLGTPKSNFIKYLADNFQAFGIKKIIATHYEKDKKSAKYILDKNNTGKNVICIEDVMEEQLKGDGDFRSEECIELLKQSDIVITNPPFSFFREYVARLYKYKKKFVIIGNTNAITYKEIFTLIKNNKMWTGVTNFNVGMYFEVPDNWEKYHKMVNGKKYVRNSNSCWFTNIKHAKRNEMLDTGKNFRGFENMYQVYDNYNAINVDTYLNIPMDYNKAMGVPITFIDKYNPEQFEIVGQGQGNLYRELAKKGLSQKFVDDYYQSGGKGVIKEDHPVLGYYDLEGKAVIPYMRIIIKRKRKKK
ncbi:MAG: adenine-specific methyltransferase EcoRI family protein [Treponema sp.]|nr:adenine-specific methyltransferase EcoRI family protein [Treponema sp.]